MKALQLVLGSEGGENIFMLTLKQKIGAGVVSALMMSSLLVGSAYAADGTNAVIEENGRNSTNTILIDSTNTQTVEQTNSSNVSNTVVVSNNTGGGVIRDTDGDVDVDTGPAASDVTIMNPGNTNVAVGNGCGCPTGANVAIVDNRRGSTNTIDISPNNSLTLRQRNRMNVDNLVVSDNNTGGVRIRDNAGNVTLRTRGASAMVTINTYGGENVAVGGL